MKKNIAITVLTSVLVLSSKNIFAAPVLSDNFNNYANGNLVGQGTWLQTSTSATSPIQVNGGVVTIGNTGQDVYDAFSSAVNTTGGGSLFVGLTLDVITAKSAGDYFLHTSTAVASTSGFYDRLEARSSGAGFQLGLEESGSDPVVWGTTVLTLGQSYQVITEQDFVAGALNDTFELYVNPTDLSVAGNNTAYLNFTWNGTTAEAASYAEVNLRQGTAGSAPSETVDDLAVSETFADVVPEPSTIALLTLGGAAGLAAIRRKR